MRARLASANPHKLVELRRALPGWEIELVDDREFPPETGSTYVENARGKALHGRRSAPADAWVIGEDSGIEASGLGGRPGIASARWADDGVAQLLTELAPLEDRRARYVCVIVAIGPAGEEIVAEGTPRGNDRTRSARRGGLRLRPDLRARRRDEHRRGARRRLEDGQFAPRAGRCGVGGRPGNPGERLKPLPTSPRASPHGNW